MTHPAIRPVIYSAQIIQRAQVILSAWYLPNRRQLDLMFGSGQHYRYANVPAHIAHRFAQAASKGRFYNAEIRNSYACTQLDAELAKVA